MTGKIVVAYVVDGSGIQASQIDYSIVTHVQYSFGSLDLSGNVIVPVGLSSSFVNEVHANGAAISLVLGGYGQSTVVTTSMANNAGSNEAALVNKATAYTGSTYTYNQILKFMQNPSRSFVSKFDPVTQTAWLFHPPTMEYISYDNPVSLTAKAVYSGCMGLLGVGIWELSQDGGYLLPFLSTFLTTRPGTSCIAQALSIKSAPNLPVPPLPTAPSNPATRCGLTWTDANSNCNSFCNQDYVDHVENNKLQLHLDNNEHHDKFHHKLNVELQHHVKFHHQLIDELQHHIKFHEQLNVYHDFVINRYNNSNSNHAVLPLFS
ncbi:hypothetical protein HDU98_012163 [Podochytrium sp. JEL0797]|nr:hypothetical protein HDU98_012163 [Podochytrium sp. JEL0797]